MLNPSQRVGVDRHPIQCDIKRQAGRERGIRREEERESESRGGWHQPNYYYFFVLLLHSKRRVSAAENELCQG